MSKDRTTQFLQQMNKGQSAEADPPRAPPPSPPEPAVTAAVHQMPRAAKPSSRKAKPALSRADLKHFGGYLDDDTLEKIALLRIRLKMDNSALIKHAIEELYRKHNAKLAFGDA
jgi:hypothetical protein